MDRMEKMRQKMNGFGDKNCLAGFGLFELLAALLIIGLLTGMVVLGFRQTTPADQLKEFAAKLNSHVCNTWQKAILKQKTQKVIFDLKGFRCWSKDVLSELDESKDQELIPEKGDSLVEWDENIEFSNFYIDGDDELSKHHGTENVEKFWFFITSSGIAQPIMMNVTAKDLDREENYASAGLVLNPFSPQFRVYDEFKHPGQ